MKPVYTREPVQNAQRLRSDLASLQSVREASESGRKACTSITIFGLALSLGVSGALFSKAEAAELVLTAYLPSAPDSPQTLPSYGSDRPSGASATYHTVLDGETIWDIAKRYGIAAEEIKVANGIASDQVIQAGQVLKVPSDDAIAVALPAEPVLEIDVQASPMHESVQSEGVVEVQAASAELLVEEPLAEPRSLSEFVESRRESVDDSDMARGNSKRAVFDSDLVAVQPAPNSEADLVPEPSPTRELAVQLDTPASAVPESVSTEVAPAPEERSSYQVNEGETLWMIALAHGISIEDLRQANGIANPNLIYSGDTLVVPGQKQGAASEPSVNVARLEPTAASALESAARQRLHRAAVLAEGDSPELLSDNSAVATDPVGDDSVVVATEDLSSATALVEADSPESSLPSGNSLTERLLAESPTEADQSSSTTSIRPSAQVQEATVPLESEVALSRPANVEELTPGLAPSVDIESLDALEVPSANVEGIETEEAADPPANLEDRSEDLLAAAPLGSDVYAPIVESPEGRVVSPDLPDLPGQEEYLPEAPSRFNGYMWPAQGVLTSRYGWRWGRMHQGVDIAGPVGTPIFAAAPGVVTRSGWNSGGYGNVVDISHPDGSTTRYAHNSRLMVQAGQEVRQGQQIAEMGSTGYSTGPHLHFEIHFPSQGAVNPMAYLPGN